MSDWTGRGKGRSSKNQGTVTAEGGPGKGGGRSGSQPTIESSSSWTGKGGGRSSSQPSLGDSSSLSTRSSSSGSSGSSSSSSQTDDPEGNFVFALEIDGVEVAQFLECSGLKTSTEVFELQEGGMNHRVHKLPGQSRWENITLRYGVTSDTTLLEWRGEILNDEFDAGSRRNGSIVVKNNQMEVVRRYNFEGAWPVAWEGPSFSSSSSELAIEMVELAHHGIYVS